MKWKKTPIYWEIRGTVYISIPFTWNLPRVKHYVTKSRLFKNFIIGGTALNLMPDYFNDCPNVKVGKHNPGMLQKFNPLATRTSLGCIRKCSFCAIGTGKLEGGGLVELGDWPNLPIICDNNLLACSQQHFDKVLDRLEKHKGVDFNQGLDARLLSDYHAQRFARLKSPRIRLACDDKKSISQWEQSVETLVVNGVKKSWIGTYVLIGFNSGPDEAWNRCNHLHKISSLIYPMWYHPLDCLNVHRISEQQKELGWNNGERTKIMRNFYQAMRGGYFNGERPPSKGLFKGGNYS